MLAPSRIVQANAALTVNLKAAQSTLDAVSKLSKMSNLASREARVITDFVENRGLKIFGS